MNERTLRIRTGSRLHFGLMELFPGSPHCYSGLGAMVEAPGLELEIGSLESSTNLDGMPHIECSPGLLPRVRTIVERMQRLGVVASMPDTIRFTTELPLHSGLGAGTQTACALALALREFDLGSSSDHKLAESQATKDLDCGARVVELSRWAGRGLRSAIGLQGVLSGGLILDHGYPAENEAPESRVLEQAGKPVDSLHGSNEGVLTGQGRSIRVDVAKPESGFSAALIFSPPEKTYSGQAEASIIDRLGSSSNPNQPAMWALAAEVMEAFKGNDVAQFGKHLDDYMQLAAKLFAAGQGGMYVSDTVESIVTLAQQSGLHGVGQSSWGPTVFGFAADADQLERSIIRLHEVLPAQCSVLPTQIADSGLEVEWMQG